LKRNENVNFGVKVGLEEDVASASQAAPARIQLVCDTTTGTVSEWAVHDRAALLPGTTITGPAIIAEEETSTLVSTGWTATINWLGYIELVR
jgi:N-methylhydantoinase A